MESGTRFAGWRYPALTALIAVLLSTALGVEMVRLGSVQRELKAALILAAGVAMIVAALRPDTGLAMLLILTPFEFHFSGTGTDEVLLIAMALVMAWRIRARAVPAWVSIGVLALVLGSFATVPGAQDQGEALWGAIRWLAGGIVLFAAIGVLRDKPDASRRMIDIFTASAVVVVLFALAQKAGIYVLVGPSYTGNRPSSFFGYYTNYAGYAAMAAVLATGETVIALDQRRLTRTSIYGAGLVVILVGVVISDSRGGLLALGGGWLMLMALNLRRGSLVVQAIVIVAVFVGAAYIATPRADVTAIEQRFASPLGSQGNDRARFALQKAGETALGEYPLGLGFDNARFYLRSHVHSVYVEQTFAHAQETLVQIGLDAGWLGLAGFAALFAVPIGLVLIYGGEGASMVRASAFAAALGGFIAQGLYDYLFYEIAFIVFFLAMVWGTVHALSSAEKTEIGSAVAV